MDGSESGNNEHHSKLIKVVCAGAWLNISKYKFLRFPFMENLKYRITAYLITPVFVLVSVKIPDKKKLVPPTTLSRGKCYKFASRNF